MDGAVRAVRECEVKCCPSWAVRPYQTAEQDDQAENQVDDQFGDEETKEIREINQPTVEDLARRAVLQEKKVQALIKARAARAAKLNSKE